MNKSMSHNRTNIELAQLPRISGALVGLEYMFIPYSPFVSNRPISSLDDNYNNLITTLILQMRAELEGVEREIEIVDGQWRPTKYAKQIEFRHPKRGLTTAHVLGFNGHIAFLYYEDEPTEHVELLKTGWRIINEESLDDF